MVYSKAKGFVIDAPIWLYRFFEGRKGHLFEERYNKGKLGKPKTYYTDSFVKWKYMMKRNFLDMKRKYKTISPEDRKCHQGQRNSIIQEMLVETEGVNVPSLIIDIEKNTVRGEQAPAPTMVYSKGNRAVPKISHPSICGPKNENVDKQIKETGAKMNVLPLRVRENEMVISGEKDGVIIKQKVEVMGIYMDEKRRNKTVSVEVRNSQHKYIIGPGYSLPEIFKETRVAVEVPSTLYNIENITLTREKDKLGPALTMVYSKANLAFERPAVPKLYNSLCGTESANVGRLIKETSTKVNVPLISLRKDEILISGEKDGIKNWKEAMMRIYIDKVNIKEEFKTKLPHNQHNSTIGAKGRLVKSIAGGCDDGVNGFDNGVNGFDENDGENTKKHHQEFTNEKDLVPVTEDIAFSFDNSTEEQSDKVKVTGQPAKQASQPLQEYVITINGYDDREVIYLPNYDGKGVVSRRKPVLWGDNSNKLQNN